MEKSDYFGGNTARSGGGVWVPGNYALKQARVDDTPERAKQYLDSIVGDEVPKVRRDTFIDRGPEMMDFVRDRTPVRFAWVPQYSDYHPEAPGGRPGGRSVEPVPLDGRVIGDELGRLHPPYSKAPANMVVTQANFRWLSLGFRTARGPWTMLKVFVRRFLAGLRRQKLYGMGNALMIGLRKGLIDAGVPVWYATEITDLLLDGERVVGATVVRDGKPTTVRARRGVVLCSGGFEFNLELRQKHQPSPITTDWSTGAPSNTGGGILAGIAAGADTALMDDAWWGPTIPLPRGAWFCLAERNLPGVDPGQRRRPALHERGAAVRRGGARDLQGRGHRGEPRPVLDGRRPALSQPLPLRRPGPPAAVPRPLAQERRGGEERHARRPGAEDRRAC